MEHMTVGVVGAGSQGKAIAFWFAKAGFRTIVYDASPSQMEKIIQESAELIRRNRLKAENFQPARQLEDLRPCNIIIENISEVIAIKLQLFQALEKMMGADVILASNSSSFPPTLISEPLNYKENFINIHYLGVRWGSKILELAPSRHTSVKTLQTTKELLEQAGFVPVTIRECPGFVFNRIKAAELSNTIKAYELGLVSYDNMLKYILYPSRGPWTVAFLDFLGIEISDALIRFLHEQFGERFYVSQILAEKVKKNELGIKTGKGFMEYSTGVSVDVITKKSTTPVHSRIRSIYLDEMRINNTNILLQMVNKQKEVYLSRDDAYLSVLEKSDPLLFKKIAPHCRVVEKPEDGPQYDLVITSKIGEFAEIRQRVHDLRERFGEATPLLINSPIYRISDLAMGIKNPDLILGMNAQKTYLPNTELVMTPNSSSAAYQDTRDLICELTGDCLEVADAFARPLTFLVVTKMFEAIRVLEEEITDKDTIELLCDRDTIFKDIDYFGIDNLMLVSRYLEPIYGVAFSAPALLKQMYTNSTHGVISGAGFNRYS